MQVIDCIQGSPEWHAARCGIVTASRVRDILTGGEGKTRRAYLLEIAAEKMGGSKDEGPPLTYEMQRGLELEPAVIELYGDLTGNTPEAAGFFISHQNLGGLGYSPDGLVGEDGLLEIKTRKQKLQVELLQKGEVPTEHMAQIQTGLLVTGRKWLDYISYNENIPPFLKRVYPDVSFQQRIIDELPLFYKEAHQIISNANKNVEKILAEYVSLTKKTAPTEAEQLP